MGEPEGGVNLCAPLGAVNAVGGCGAPVSDPGLMSGSGCPVWGSGNRPGADVGISVPGSELQVPDLELR